MLRISVRTELSAPEFRARSTIVGARRASALPPNVERGDDAVDGRNDDEPGRGCGELT